MQERNKMTTIMPRGEDLRKAVKWISEERTDHPDRSTGKLLNEACSRFDLSPKEADYLRRFFAQEKTDC
jgi:hypothetical protein